MDDRRRVERFLADVGERVGPGVSSTLTPDPVRAAEIVTTLADVASAEAAVTWLVRNGRRIDARIQADGREWWVVCSMDADGVHHATALERPATFAGVDGGQAVIVNGPSSVGKTETMAAVVRRATTPWVAFDELFFGDVPTPYLVWPETAPTLKAGFVDGIAALARAGNQVITTGGAPAIFAPLRAAVPTLVVGLECPIDVRIARQARRTDRWGGLTEDSDDAHDGWDYDVRFDTDALTADEIASRILDRL